MVCDMSVLVLFFQIKNTDGDYREKCFLCFYLYFFFSVYGKHFVSDCVGLLIVWVVHV